MIRKPANEEFRVGVLQTAAYKTGLVIDDFAAPRPDRVSPGRAKLITSTIGFIAPLAALLFVVAPIVILFKLPVWVFGLAGPALCIASLLLMTFVHSRLSPSSYGQLAQGAAAQIARSGAEEKDYLRRSVARPVWYVVGRLLRGVAVMAMIFWFFAALAASDSQQAAAIMLAMIVGYVVFDALLKGYRKRALGKSVRGDIP